MRGGSYAELEHYWCCYRQVSVFTWLASRLSMLTTVTSRSLALVLIINGRPVKVSCVTLTTGDVVDTSLLEVQRQSFKESGTTRMELDCLFDSRIKHSIEQEVKTMEHLICFVETQTSRVQLVHFAVKYLLPMVPTKYSVLT